MFGSPEKTEAKQEFKEVKKQLRKEKRAGDIDKEKFQGVKKLLRKNWREEKKLKSFEMKGMEQALTDAYATYESSMPQEQDSIQPRGLAGVIKNFFHRLSSIFGKGKPDLNNLQYNFMSHELSKNFNGAYLTKYSNIDSMDIGRMLGSYDDIEESVQKMLIQNKKGTVTLNIQSISHMESICSTLIPRITKQLQDAVFTADALPQLPEGALEETPHGSGIYKLVSSSYPKTYVDLITGLHDGSLSPGGSYIGEMVIHALNANFKTMSDYLSKDKHTIDPQSFHITPEKAYTHLSLWERS